jgi:hypothetical protein
MTWRPNVSRRKFIACLAALCVLVQAGLVAWHVSANFAVAAQTNGDHAALCHADGAATNALHDGNEPNSGDHHGLLDGCSCCQGLLAGGTIPQDAAVASPQQPEIVRLSASAGTISSGSHPLAPDSRAPPHTI